MKKFKDLILLVLRYKREIIFGLISLFIVDIAHLIMPLIIRGTIDSLALGIATGPLLTKYALYIIALALIGAFFRYLWRYYIIGSSRKVEQYLRNKLFFHLQSLSASFFDRTKTGDLMARSINDIDAVRMATGPGVARLVDAILFFVFSLAFMLRISPTLTLYTVIPLSFTTIIVTIFGKRIHNRFEKVQKGFADITEQVRESLSGIREIKAFVQEKGKIKEFRKVNEEFVAKNMSLVKVWGMFFPLIMLIGGLATAMVILFGGRKVILNEVSLGDMVAFSTYLGMLTWPLMSIGWVVNLVQRGAASMGRINKILLISPEIKDEKDAIKMDIQGKIEYRHLSFAYPDRKELALKNIDLLIEPGVRLGIVGKVGSGKTTLIQLLLRVYDPPSGHLFIDNVDIRKISLSSLRKDIGVVPQESILFSTSIRENIAFGNSEISEEEIIEIAKRCKIYEEIKEFPHGLDTIVGERGITLSGGQKQRIALARAILMNPRVLILDDAFSSVDTETEEAILQNLKEIMRNRTSIIISQRISSVKDLDFIIVLDEGEIVERGTHEELLNLNGIYANLYERQKIAKEEEEYLRL
ncbi:ABC transporter ATP-binding protein [Candidatus Aerophobetes bacterium]|nr:ABC transporter ATP-binding protein [Candidatus Aerophobetes bacterium]